MHFIKIKVVYTTAPKSVWRTFYVTPDIGLDELGAGIVAAFNGQFGHSFDYTVGDNSYYLKGILEYMEGFSNCFDLNKYTLHDLLKFNEKIRFCYDSGDNNMFTIKVIDGEKDINFDSSKDNVYERHIILDKGRGYGIYEDHVFVMYSLLNGKSIEDICDDMGIEVDDFFFDFPTTIDDYFAPLDLEYLDDEVESSYLIFQESVEYHNY